MQKPLHPLHAILLAGTLPLCFGVLLSDIAYCVTYEMQWKNFASWLIVGALGFGGVALLAALIEFLRRDVRGLQSAFYPSLLLAMWFLGFINAFVHAGDAWATIPAGPVLSVMMVLLAMAATASGFYRAYFRVPA